MSQTQIGLAGFALICGLAFFTWVASYVRTDVSLVDRVWSLLIGGAALVYFLLQPATMRGVVMAVLVTAWAVRLGIYITARNWGHSEDRRYQAIRARNQPGFEWKSLYLVFLLQAVLAWIVATPFLEGMPATAPFGALDVLGIAIVVVGFVFETVGDSQMARFKADAANRGQVMDHGLWRYTRHPNYFGETCVWWGFWLIALGGAGWGAAWTIISPLLMTVLLLKVSGVSLLEQDIGERRPAYQYYIRRTSAFFPWFPK